jgi:hypothetical protein
VVVLADNDPAGRSGALRLARRLVIEVGHLRVLAPPCRIKDARAWHNAGATRDDVLSAIQSTQFVQVAIRAVEARNVR